MFVNDHFSNVFVSSLDFDNKKCIAQNLYRDTKNYSRTELNKRIALTDWRAMYHQTEAKPYFNCFQTCLKMLNSLAPIKTGESTNSPNKKVDIHKNF